MTELTMKSENDQNTLKTKKNDHMTLKLKK